MPPSKPVAGYYRVSVARDDMKAPELYEDEIRRYCSYKNVELGRLYSDIDYSAFRGAKARPSLEELIADRHLYSAVIVPKLSRFGRSMKELVKLFEIFDNDSIPLVFLDMNLDTSTSQGRLLRHILAAFAEYESDVKADYARASIRRAAEAGLPHGYMPPYGYRRLGQGDERKLVLDRRRAAIVREVFTRYAAGEGFSAIGRDLDERGVRGARGGRWSREHIRLLIDQPAYVGLRRHNGELFPAQWPPIVTRELWEKAQARRDANRQGWRAPRPKALLSGLMFCGHCGRKLACLATHAGARVYKCWSGSAPGPICPGGQTVMLGTDALVRDAIGQLFELVGDGELQDRADAWTSAWEQASDQQRRPLVAEIVDRITLLPRPLDNRLGKGLRRGRTICITWAEPWSSDVFGHAEATSILSSNDRDVRSARGKSWAEWQKLNRPRSVASGAATSPGRI